MEYNISKRILENYSHPKLGNFLSAIVIAVHDRIGIIGTFFCSENVAYIDYTDQNFRINISHKLFESDKYIIVDKDDAKIGEYHINFPSSRWSYFGSVEIGNREFHCKTLKPDIKYSPLNRGTWGHYKIKIFDDQDEVVYKLKMDVPVLDAK